MFPISQSDALRLRRGLAELAHSDSDRAGRVVQRARDAVARMRETFPGDAVTGVVWEDDPRFEEFGEDEVCPALDPATHTCDLYQWRLCCAVPSGRPWRQADGCITACELCYQGATEEQMAACAVTMPAADRRVDVGGVLSGRGTLEVQAFMRPPLPLRKPEIMSPAGYWPQLRAAVEAGADAVYFGLKHFSARAKVGFSLSELPEVMRTLHQRGVRGYVTFNTLVFEHELEEAGRPSRR